ncbi:MAG: toll/interleukin-1 receptor domain-containing protein [Oligoflexia bacterium]|nr:toll/interleukin-1 receptor domain-containing protein [Oligoflexia bacterium]
MPLEDASIPDLLGLADLADLAEDHTPVWDVFLAYSRADRERVTALQAALQARGCTVFRDETGVKPGQDWPFAIRNAQRSALCTVVALSRATPAAHFLRDEIQRALSYRRKYGHHVIPVGLHGVPDAEQMPSGLMVLQAIDLPAVGGVAAAADLLAQRVRELRS